MALGRSGWLLVLFVVAACGPRVILAPKTEEKPPTFVAVLPSAAPDDLTPVRVRYLEAALRTELQSARFFVLDSRIVTAACAKGPCEKVLLEKGYPIEGFLRLELTPFGRHNFIAGYYNRLSGKLSLVNTEGTQIAEVTNTEREAGGLVFQSGQVLEALVDQYENTPDESFNRLGRSFIKTMVDELPKPRSAAAMMRLAAPVEIQAVNLRQYAGPIYELCVSATSGGIASLLVQGRRASLREHAPGRYCGTFPYVVLVEAQTPMVEVRSPFGLPARKTVELATAPPCDLGGKLRLSRSAQASTVAVSCDDASRRSECEAEVEGCRKFKLIVYRSPSELGPFERAGELNKSLKWVDRGALRGGPAYYHVVAVDPAGVRSATFEVRTAEQTAATGSVSR